MANGILFILLRTGMLESRPRPMTKLKKPNQTLKCTFDFELRTCHTKTPLETFLYPRDSNSRLIWSVTVKIVSPIYFRVGFINPLATTQTRRCGIMRTYLLKALI